MNKEFENENEVVNPITLTMTETGIEYTLEFTRESVKFAEYRGFDVSKIESAPMTTIPDLFYYSFRAHHPKMNHEQTDKILFGALGGMPDGMLERLCKLYYKPLKSLMGDEENNEERKNAKVTVQF